MTRLPLNPTALALMTAAAIAIALPASAREGGPRGGSPEARTEMFLERFDTNGDGQVTEAEIAEARAARFSDADANGDGLLSAEEMAAMAETERETRRARGIERMIERHDANGDGLLSAEELAEAGPGTRIFERLDANEDGVITEEELAEARPFGRGGHRSGGHGPRGGDRGAAD
jgi:Ca2+-binding EF-hand superfamily protein